MFAFLPIERIQDRIRSAELKKRLNFTRGDAISSSEHLGKLGHVFEPGSISIASRRAYKTKAYNIEWEKRRLSAALIRDEIRRAYIERAQAGISLKDQRAERIISHKEAVKVLISTQNYCRPITR